MGHSGDGFGYCPPSADNCFGSRGAWGDGQGGGGRSGVGIESCGVDPFCIANGGIGPFGSPVAYGFSWSDAVVTPWGVYINATVQTDYYSESGDYLTSNFAKYINLIQFSNSPMASGPANNSSWGWNFTKAFFGGLVSSAGWKAVYHSFGEGGCDNLMVSTFADVFNPLPGDGLGASDAAELGPKAVAGAGQAAASAYSLYQGLSVPLRSSIYRGLQSSTYVYAEAVGTAAPYALVGYAGGKALITAGSAAYNGECH